MGLGIRPRPCEFLWHPTLVKRDASYGGFVPLLKRSRGDTVRLMSSSPS